MSPSRRVGPPSNCPDVESAASSWLRGIGIAELAAPSCPRPLLLVCDCFRLSKVVVPPRIVREMSWVCNYWPENMPYPYTSSDRSTLSALDRPEIQRYCLMSVKDSFTDFHIDFGGTSVWYHVLRVSVVKCKVSK